MKSILEEIWQGICPDTESRKNTKETRALMRDIADHHDNLYATLADKGKDLLDKFDDCQAELMSINEREIFVYAFRLGARVAFEVMSFDNE